MITLVPRFLSVPKKWLTKETAVYFRPRPQEIVNYALTALAFDLLVTLAAFLLANEIAGEHLFNEDYGLYIALSVVVVWLTMFLTMAVYPAERLHSLGKEAFRATLAIVNGACIVVAVLSLLGATIPRDFILVFIALNVFMVIVWRLITHALFHIPPFNRVIERTMVIGVNDLSLSFAEMVAKNPKSQINLCGFLDDCADQPVMDFPVLGNLQEDLQVIIEKHQIDSAVIVVPNQPDAAFAALLEKLQILPLRLHLIPEDFKLDAYRASAETVERMLTMVSPRNGISMRERMLKRLLDVMIASLGLLLVLPVAVVITIAIKLDSSGPIFFKQLRVGEYQRRFHMYKFRSMAQDAEVMQKDVNVTDEQGNVIHKRRNDPRVTRVGKIIRKTSLDELPQLLNVLLGDMSLVGPRPEMPWVVNSYKPWQYQRFVVPPGMTGWWQINGRKHDEPMYMGTNDDLYYIENYSFLLDLRILALTIPVILTGQGSF